MNQLRNPPNWSPGLTPLAKFGLVVGAGLGLYSAAQTVVAIHRGSLMGTLTTAGFTVFFVFAVAAVICTVQLSNDTGGTWNNTGTQVQVHASIAWCYGTSLLGGAVGSASYLLGGRAELPFAANSDTGGISRYLITALLVLSVVSLVALLRSRESGHVRVGPDGVEHSDMFRTRTIRWDAVTGVVDKTSKRARNPLVLEMKSGQAVVVPNADRLGPGGGALYWMTRHYWLHPEDRDELTDGRATDRLHRGDFTTT